MAQAWHRRAIPQRAQPEGLTYWLASKYRRLRATPEAVWKRFNPFDVYKPTSKTREVKAGPHLAFLKLKELQKDKDHNYVTALDVFSSTYGLLGLFYEVYSPPILPHPKIFVAPEGVIDKYGRLRRVDSMGRGVKLLLDLLHGERPMEDEQEREMIHRELVASPSELRFAHKRYTGLWAPDPSGQELSTEQTTWEEAKERYGGVLVLDARSSSRVSVLCTKESSSDWDLKLEDFPAPPYDMSKPLTTYLNKELIGVSPLLHLSEDGDYERGWRCPSLLKAMYLMLWFDLTGGSAIRQCESRSCSNYFQVGSQSRTKYCSERHANLASTRMGRGQEP
jgi:hypothetical protein